VRLAQEHNLFVYLKWAAPYQGWIQTKQGLDAIAQALAQIEETGERFLEAEAYRIRGELMLKDETNPRLEAEDCFLQAIEIPRGQQAKSWELRATMSLAHLWQQNGRGEEARP